MTPLKLEAVKRQVGKKGRKALSNDQLPGVVYGRSFPSTPVTVDRRALEKLVREVGTSQLFDLEIKGSKSQSALIKDLDRDPVSGSLRHFDAYIIKKGEKITTEIPIHLVGEAPAAKLGLLIHQQLDQLEVTVDPTKLPEAFEVNIADLQEVGDSIRVRDLNLSGDLEVAEELLDQPIVKVDAPREIEEEPEEEVAEEAESAADVPSEHGGEGDSDTPSDQDDSGQEQKA